MTEKYFYEAHLKRAIDGDTYVFRLVKDVDFGFGFFVTVNHDVTVRIKGVDTAEIFRPRNATEKAHGMEAKKFVEDAMKDKPITIHTFKDRTGKYGRYIADVRIGGTDLGEMLVKADMVKRDSYNGE